MRRSAVNPLSLLVCFIASVTVFLASGAPKERHSLKKRLATESDIHENAPAQTSSSSASTRSMKQRLQSAEAEQKAAEPVQPTPLTDQLKKDWAQGKIAAITVQKYAEKAAAQGAKWLSDVAAAGTHGKHASSVHRSLIRLFGYPKGAPPIDWVEIPTRNGRESHPFIFPHKLFATLYKERHNYFLNTVRGAPGAARSFWEELVARDNPFVKKHPLIKDFDHTLPLGVHGDAGAFTKHDSLMVISWNGLLGMSGESRVKRFVFTFVRKATYTPETLDRIFTLLSWSFNAMARGLEPTLNWDDNPTLLQPSALAGPYTGVLTHIRGDWQFYVEIFQFPPWNGAIRMCWLCRASSSIEFLAFTNCAEGAQWHNTRFSDESYRAHMRGLGLVLPVLLLLVIGLRLECILIDALHSLDLGFSSHVIANTMWEGVKRRVWGAPNQEENVELLEADMVQYCKDKRAPSRVQGELT